MTTTDLIRHKISSALQYEHFDLVNESHMHAGPKTESHFKLIIVSKEFYGQAKIKRHQLIYRILSDELSNSIHALSLHLFTPEEWSVQNVPDSPLCAGKNIPS
jgi:BolA family transcriptional regulator, general stress-responsive regulator